MSDTEFFNEFMLLKSLNFKHGGSTLSDFSESMIDDLEEEGKIQLKQVCARISPELSGRVDNACGILDISKTKFIEMAIINALGKIEEISAEYDIFDSKDAHNA